MLDYDCGYLMRGFKRFLLIFLNLFLGESAPYSTHFLRAVKIYEPYFLFFRQLHQLNSTKNCQNKRFLIPLRPVKLAKHDFSFLTGVTIKMNLTLTFVSSKIFLTAVTLF